MNIINFAINEIKSTLRDTRTLTFMLAFPIILILILGTALSGAFSSDNTVSLDKISIVYKDNSTGEFSKYFGEFVKQAEREGIKFEKVDDVVDAKNKVEKRKYQGFIEINNDSVKLYENDRTSIEGNIVEGMLKGFIDKYKLISEVVKVKPQGVGVVVNDNSEGSYIKETSLNSKSAPGAIDYYSIAMTTMIGLYGAISACFLIRGERMNKTDTRLIAAPVRKSEILIGKVLGGIGANLLCVLVVMLVSKYAFKANWGSNIGLVILVLLTEVILATSFGLGVSYITKKPEAPRAIVMLVVQVASFLGGAYFPITSENSTGILNFLVKLSPLSWNNEAINKLIYTSDSYAVIPAIVINMAVACLFLVISGVIAGRREAL
ncbi:ABC transporter permease [Clostridium paridis]|uniref:ABC transporter permease n=1 Tax=Clostridium paridis TaxID=2803863 RepID=A0A937K6C7_9CLOT|nr:ABC transporter permease [Clostridium paridis]